MIDGGFDVIVADVDIGGESQDPICKESSRAVAFDRACQVGLNDVPPRAISIETEPFHVATQEQAQARHSISGGQAWSRITWISFSVGSEQGVEGKRFDDQLTRTRTLAPRGSKVGSSLDLVSTILTKDLALVTCIDLISRKRSITASRSTPAPRPPSTTPCPTRSVDPCLPSSNPRRRLHKNNHLPINSLRIPRATHPPRTQAQGSTLSALNRLH
jgi:hypothetical protein